MSRKRRKEIDLGLSSVEGKFVRRTDEWEAGGEGSVWAKLELGGVARHQGSDSGATSELWWGAATFNRAPRRAELLPSQQLRSLPYTPTGF
jgi:hypothetical protein